MLRRSLTLTSIVCLLACGDSEPKEDGGNEGARDASLADSSEPAEPARDAGAGASDSGTTMPARDSGSRAEEDAGTRPSDAGNVADSAAAACTKPEEQKFSFFLISYAAIKRESGSSDGFGGNLGGISGADAICQRVAETSSPCQKSKTWRAFLSTSKENAADRIGKGPWHDRSGRLVANTLADLIQERPRGADMAIVNDLPNEDGVPNRNPDGTGNVDNHQILTGSGTDGKLYNPGDAGTSRGNACGPNGEMWTKEKATCWDWTSAEPQGCPRVGHSWPRQGSGLHWISVGNEGGCLPGASLEERGGLDGTRRVGSAGGYGGFYCFALSSP